jgi:BlaI family transcriptional regulator, penicillinase repressor
MHVLWKRPEATVAEVLAALRGRPRLAYNTVLTTLRILEQKGYLSHGRAGRAFVYRARVAEDQARRQAIRHLVARLFDKSPSELVRYLMVDRETDPAEVDRIRQLLATAGGA